MPWTVEEPPAIVSHAIALPSFRAPKADFVARVTGGSGHCHGGSENSYMLDGAWITDPVSGSFSLAFDRNPRR